MNIYFSCSITGGRAEQPVYQQLVDAMLQDGHTVPTAHLSEVGIHTLEAVEQATDVYARDVKWVIECDALVAEISTPSHGVGYEIALAESLGKPVFCCFAIGKRVSKMLTGNPSPRFFLRSYATPEEAVSNMREFLMSISKV